MIYSMSHPINVFIIESSIADADAAITLLQCNELRQTYFIAFHTPFFSSSITPSAYKHKTIANREKWMSESEPHLKHCESKSCGYISGMINDIKSEK